jgi:hypothetical protein
VKKVDFASIRPYRGHTDGMMDRSTTINKWKGAAGRQGQRKEGEGEQRVSSNETSFKAARVDDNITGVF